MQLVLRHLISNQDQVPQIPSDSWFDFLPYQDWILYLEKNKIKTLGYL